MVVNTTVMTPSAPITAAAELDTDWTVTNVTAMVHTLALCMYMCVCGGGGGVGGCVRVCECVCVRVHVCMCVCGRGVGGYVLLKVTFSYSVVILSQ